MPAASPGCTHERSPPAATAIPTTAARAPAADVHAQALADVDVAVAREGALEHDLARPPRHQRPAFNFGRSTAAAARHRLEHQPAFAAFS